MTLDGIDPRPFLNESFALLMLPVPSEVRPDHQHIVRFNQLILSELPELEAEVGTKVVAVSANELQPGQATILVGPANRNVALARWQSTQRRELPNHPSVAIDRNAKVVVLDAADIVGIGDAMQLLRTAIAERSEILTGSLCESADEVINRVDAEVRRTFPRLGERAPDWDVAVEHARRSMQDADDLSTVQRLMATLRDAHSWAKDTRLNGRLPYAIHDNGEIARFWSVPEASVAWEIGARPGDVVRRPDTTQMRDRAGSTPHSRGWTIGYRALAGRVGEAVELEAVRDDGSVVRWMEEVPALPWAEPITLEQLDVQTGYLRIRGWLNTAEWQDAFANALAEADRFDRLVVDLRGNVGGALVAAQNARNNFLPERTLLGTIQYSNLTGTMSPPNEVLGEPPASGPCWTKPVRFVTDPLCYSATEDFLLGLQGLPHVQLIGQSTGGGSGRPRTIRLREHLIVTISTALTFDREGRCIEGNGFQPDVPIEPDFDHPDSILDHVLAHW